GLTPLNRQQGTQSTRQGQTGTQPGQNGNAAPPGSAGIIGVASESELESVKLYNSRQHYNEWEFIAVLQQPGQQQRPGQQQPGQQQPGQQQPGQQNRPGLPQNPFGMPQGGGLGSPLPNQPFGFGQPQPQPPIQPLRRPQ